MMLLYLLPGLPGISAVLYLMPLSGVWVFRFAMVMLYHLKTPSCSSEVTKGEHKDVSSGPQHSHQDLGVVAHACNPNIGRQRQKGLGGD